MPMSVSARSTASEIRRKIRRAPNRFFRTGEFDGSRPAIEKALGRLVEDGELLRVRNGLYWRGARTPFGMAPPNPRTVVHEYADGYPIGPAGISAANLLGLSSQVPRIPEYAVPRSVPPIDRIRLVRRDARRSNGRRAARLTESEVALLEVLDSWEEVVELVATEALERLRVILLAGTVRPDRLVRASGNEPARVRERLRFLLELAGEDRLSESVRPASTRGVAERALRPFGAAAA
ncbi:MAG: type IV toxin-antitoxin system AbiEi family antitoxin domain-containing protein [Acidimicrobiia bacterium]